MAMASTAGVPLKIALSEPPKPVTTRIIAEVFNADSTQASLAFSLSSLLLILR